MPQGRNKTRLQLIFVGLAILIAIAAAAADANFSADIPKTEPILAINWNLGDVAGVVEKQNIYTRINVGNLVLIKQKGPDSSLTEVDGLFEGDLPIIIAKCFSVNACLKARQIMEPLATDDQFQQKYYTVIIEAFDALRPPKPGYDGIIYIFSLPNCGVDMGSQEYTSTGLKETAVAWYNALSTTCEADQQQ